MSNKESQDKKVMDNNNSAANSKAGARKTTSIAIARSKSMRNRKPGEGKKHGETMAVPWTSTNPSASEDVVDIIDITGKIKEDNDNNRDVKTKGDENKSNKKKWIVTECVKHLVNKYADIGATIILALCIGLIVAAVIWRRNNISDPPFTKSVDKAIMDLMEQDSNSTARG